MEVNRKPQAVFDKSGVMENIGGDVQLLKELLTLFLEDYPQRLTAIHFALENKDWQKAAMETHSLKGTLSNLGAVIAKEHAASLNKLCRSGTPVDCITPYAGLRESVEEFAQALKMDLS
ncbi:MAG: Hpt domain-containing protein [Fibrobacterota bacterium]